METFLILAEMYGASHPAELLFPPAVREQEQAFAAAYALLRQMTPEDRAQWIAMGERLTRPALPAPAGGGSGDSKEPSQAVSAA